jgi:hypothetical protein
MKNIILLPLKLKKRNSITNLVTGKIWKKKKTFLKEWDKMDEEKLESP